jgi:hypothetical protein
MALWHASGTTTSSKERAPGIWHPISSELPQEQKGRSRAQKQQLDSLTNRPHHLSHPCRRVCLPVDQDTRCAFASGCSGFDHMKMYSGWHFLHPLSLQYAVHWILRCLAFQGIQIWKAHAKNKCKVSTWILMHGKVLTADNLQRRGWPHQDHCALCNGPVEIGLHLCLGPV